ncbi:hypothetical protein SAMN02927916_4247 [Flavobacterium anhuiense]|uniref:Uncharacterized protein n=1 Tax=Flavobacterium anhuiense TaxID=459526 RepID=A0ABY0M2S2_9FLAO|nr:hypothetical protein SAMN02927916_4247 [Flavobacterium anhuiense]
MAFGICMLTIRDKINEHKGIQLIFKNLNLAEFQFKNKQSIFVHDKKSNRSTNIKWQQNHYLYQPLF